jgi:glycosyltransferase involved in cell wall biosynthesis
MTREPAHKRGAGGTVLHIIPYQLFPLMGPCYRCLRQLRALREQGMEVALVTPRVPEQDREKLKDPLFDGISVYPVLPAFPPAILRELGYLLFSWRRILRCVRDLKPVLVQVHNPPDTLAFVTSLVCAAMRVPLVYDIHDSARELIESNEFNPVMKKIYLAVALFFEAQTLKRSSGIVTVSESLKTAMLKTRPVLKQYQPHFVVMRNIDPSLERIAVLPVREEDIIFYSGTLYSPMLGIEFLIDAIGDLLSANGTRLIIAGEGPHRPVLDRYATDRHLRDAVIFTGHISRNEVISYVKKATLTVIPYEQNILTEIALPNKLFEYMAYAKPIVYPDFSGFREVLGDGNAGRYGPGDRTDCRRVVQALLNDPQLRKQTGENNKQKLGTISFENEFAKLLDMYRLILVRM